MKRKQSEIIRPKSSYKVFMSFVKRTVKTVNREQITDVDATGILSKECFEGWLESRRCEPKKPQEAFRRALTAHCRGVDGRRPFPADVEASLLTELRKKKLWKCFEDLPRKGSIGVQGFPSKGYHEAYSHHKKKKEAQEKLEQSNPLEENSSEEKKVNSNPQLAQWQEEEVERLLKRQKIWSSLQSLQNPLQYPLQSLSNPFALQPQFVVTPLIYYPGLSQPGFPNPFSL